MSKILIIGGKGQLGQCMQALASENGMEISIPAKNEANILDVESLAQLFNNVKPDFIVNCAAYTAVDLAEDEVEQAKAINHIGPGNLARLCKSQGISLIHISTDFVFEGNQVKLLNENDLTAPINVYGKTKLDGEQAIALVLEEHFIIRTSWLYSEYANNFVKTMLRLGAERDSLGIIADQVGTPTYAIDLAKVIYAIIASGSQEYGTYHYSNEGVTSWFDFAKAVFDISKTEVKANPIPASSYPTKAKRPSFSVMDKTKIKSTFKLEIPYWRESLMQCINKING